MLAGVIVAAVAAVRKFGKLSIFVVGPLVDLLFVAPYFVVLGMAQADPTDGAPMLLEGYRSTIGTSFAINGIADVAIIWLAAGWRLPEWTLPLRGLWARKLLAAVAILAAFLCPVPMLLSVSQVVQVQYTTTPGVPAWVGLLPVVLVALLGIGYATPLWFVLVHGWNWLKPANTDTPASRQP